VKAQKQAVKDQVTLLKKEVAELQENGMIRQTWEIHQQIASLLEKLIEWGKSGLK